MSCHCARYHQYTGLHTIADMLAEISTGENGVCTAKYGLMVIQMSP